MTAYLEKQADGTFVLYTESEYLFDGEFTVDGKTLVIERSIAAGVRSYTVSYDGADAVDYQTRFQRKFLYFGLERKILLRDLDDRK